MKRVCTFILLIICVFCLQGSQSQVETAPEKFKVAVLVDDDDHNDYQKSQNNLISSHIKREL